MSKVYLVTEQNCEDYRVMGAFSSEEKAQEYVDQFKQPPDQNDSYCIETFEVDHYTEQIKQGIKTFTIIMDKEYKSLPLDPIYNWEPNTGKYPGGEKWRWLLNKTDTPDLLAVVLATDNEDATKIVTRQVNELITAGLWPHRDYIDYPQHVIWGRSFEEFVRLTRERVEGVEGGV